MGIRSSVEGHEGSNQPNCQSNLAIALYEPCPLFCNFIDKTAYHLLAFEPSSPSPSPNELHGMG